MTANPKIVISASRRTDIPALYMPWFMDRIDKGFFEVANPYNQRITIVPATPDKVHTIVFWSKNFGPFLEHAYGETLMKMGFNLFFNFTLNSNDPILEPNLPPLHARMRQLERLCQFFHPETINWRFDPICFYTLATSNSTKKQSNLTDFQTISEKAAGLGIRRCITSFMDHYPKIQKRTGKMSGFSFVDPPLETKIEVLLWMKKNLDDRKVALHTCCEKDLLENLSDDTGITNSSCIPNDLLVEIFGGHLSFKKDTGQRIKQGCGCMTSMDIGSYSLHPCYHNCLFCYANPVEKEN